MTPTQLLIAYIIVKRLFSRVILVLPTQYGKSLCVALAVLLRAVTHKEKWAVIAPTEDKARIIMDYIIEHIFDDEIFVEQLEYKGTKEQLKQEKSKTRLTFREGGEIRVYTADARNTQAVKKALTGFGSPNIILDESGLMSDEIYSMVKRMLGGTKDNFLLEIGNPFFKNHFYRMFLNLKRYARVWIDAKIALEEGRYTQDFLDEMKAEAFYDVLYDCEFPDSESDVPPGYRKLISDAFIHNAFISQDLPIGHNPDGTIIDQPILGIDPNHGGKNRSSFVVRYPKIGFSKLVLLKRYDDMKGKDITGEQLADTELLVREYGIAPDRIVVDGGNGGALGDALIRKGYQPHVVMFGESADDSARYANQRAELYFTAAKAIKTEYHKLVQNDGFLELMVINYKQTSTGKLQMEPKDKMAERGIESPDTADAFVLTFKNLGDGESYDLEII